MASRERDHPPLNPTWIARRERVRRELQRPPARRVPESAPIPQRPARPRSGHGVGGRLQHHPSPLGARRAIACRVHRCRWGSIRLLRPGRDPGRELTPKDPPRSNFRVGRTWGSRQEVAALACSDSQQHDSARAARAPWPRVRRGRVREPVDLIRVKGHCMGDARDCNGHLEGFEWDSGWNGEAL